MDNLNRFFKKLYSSPTLIWSAIMAPVFIIFGLVVYLNPSLTGELDPSTRKWLAAIMLAYGLFRGYSFYSGYKNLRND